MQRVKKVFELRVTADWKEYVSITAKKEPAFVNEPLAILRDRDARFVIANRAAADARRRVRIIQRVAHGKLESHFIIFEPGILKLDCVFPFTR